MLNVKRLSLPGHRRISHWLCTVYLCFHLFHCFKRIYVLITYITILLLYYISEMLNYFYNLLFEILLLILWWHNGVTYEQRNIHSFIWNYDLRIRVRSQISWMPLSLPTTLVHLLDNRTCPRLPYYDHADMRSAAVTLWPRPLQVTSGPVFARLFLSCVITEPFSNMAAAVANKCVSPLTFLTRRFSAPEFITQCCYHKKVKY